MSPLAVGSAHRPVLITLLAAVGLATVALLVGLARTGGKLRVGASAILPAAFVLICALQSLPIPLGLRNAIDPAGGTLLANASEPHRAHPLTLDPPSTRRELGKAAAILAVFLICYHVGSGRRSPRRFIYTVAAAGVCALVIGLGHSAIGERSIFGRFKTGGLLVVGPFVNPNHTAEFLELAAFAALAMAFLARRRSQMWAWMGVTVALAAGAVATLSRGSVFALTVGSVAVAILGRKTGRGDEVRTRRPPVAKMLVGGVLGVVVIAGSLGAGSLIDELARTDRHDAKLAVWSDATSVARAHPMGIGRGAFEYVYPAYQNPAAIKGLPYSTRFAFVENGPLQLLIDAGWIGIALLLISATVHLHELVRSGWMGRAEAALVGGVAAVLAHNLLDFGLEISGIAVPFAAVLGTLLGRRRPPEASNPRGAIVAPVLALAGLVLGVSAIAAPSSGDFDAAIRNAEKPDDRLALARKAQLAHPVDYFYVLAEAQGLPLLDADGKSPRLAALNRALRLCQTCSTIHEQVANALWELGLHDQALAQLRVAINNDASVIRRALIELRRRRATPDELLALDTGDTSARVAIAEALSAQKFPAHARRLLTEPPREPPLIERFFAAKVNAELADGAMEAAARSLASWATMQPRSPRLFSARASLAQRNRQEDEAAAILDAGFRENPGDLQLVTERAWLAITRRRWTDVSRAIEDMRRALLESGGRTAPVYVWEARLAAATGGVTKAISFYDAAVTEEANNADLWLEFGRFAESADRLEAATRAFGRLVQVDPTNKQAKAALERIDERRRLIKSEAPLSD